MEFDRFHIVLSTCRYHKFVQSPCVDLQQYRQQTGTTVIFSTHDRLQGIALADDTVNLVMGKTTQTPLLNLFHDEMGETLFNFSSSMFCSIHLLCLGNGFDKNSHIILLSSICSIMAYCYDQSQSSISEMQDQLWESLLKKGHFEWISPFWLWNNWVLVCVCSKSKSRSGWQRRTPSARHHIWIRGLSGQDVCTSSLPKPGIIHQTWSQRSGPAFTE